MDKYDKILNEINNTTADRVGSWGDVIQENSKPSEIDGSMSHLNFLSEPPFYSPYLTIRCLTEESQIGWRARLILEQYLRVLYNVNISRFIHYPLPSPVVSIETGYPIFTHLIQFIRYIDVNKYDETKYINSAKHFNPFPEISQLVLPEVKENYISLQRKSARSHLVQEELSIKFPKTARDLVPLDIIDNLIVLQKIVIDRALDLQQPEIMDLTRLLKYMSESPPEDVSPCLLSCLDFVVRDRKVRGNICLNSSNAVDRLLAMYIMDPYLEVLAYNAFNTLKSSFHTWFYQERSNFNNQRLALLELKEIINQESRIYDEFSYLVQNSKDIAFPKVVGTVRDYLTHALSKSLLAQQLIADRKTKKFANILMVIRPEFEDNDPTEPEQESQTSKRQYRTKEIL